MIAPKLYQAFVFDATTVRLMVLTRPFHRPPRLLPRIARVHLETSGNKNPSPAPPNHRQKAGMAQAPNILVVEDDRETRTLIAKYLRNNACNVTTATDGREMVRAMTDHRVDLLILDVMLPGEDGLSLCRKVRAESQMPIIMLTARGEDVDRIVGLEMGADDYLAKPFNPRELLARINAVLRRQNERLMPGAPAVEPEKVSFGNMTVNLATRTLERDSRSISLTTGEFALLKVLVTHPRTPLSRDKLMELARGREYEVFDRSIDVQVSRLRKLVEKDPAHPAYIQTVWGFGYVFVPDGRTQ